MNRELHRLIKGIRRLSSTDLARLHTYVSQLHAANLRELPAELKAAILQAVPAAAAPATGPADEPAAATPADAEPATTGTTSAWKPAVTMPFRRQRAFASIDDEDLRPIANLVREANDHRAVTRQRFGAV